MAAYTTSSAPKEKGNCAWRHTTGRRNARRNGATRAALKPGAVGQFAVDPAPQGLHSEWRSLSGASLPCDSLPVILARSPYLSGNLGVYGSQSIAEFFGFSGEASDALLAIALFVCLRAFVHVRLPPSE